MLLSFACPNYSYFLLALKESNKEKAPEMITFVFCYARYTSPLPATHKPKVRAISGFPSHNMQKNSKYDLKPSAETLIAII